MRKTNEELDALIADQEKLIAVDSDKVDVSRGHISRDNSQLIKNRREAIRALESQKEVITVNLRAGI